MTSSSSRRTWNKPSRVPIVVVAVCLVAAAIVGWAISRPAGEPIDVAEALQRGDLKAAKSGLLALHEQSPEDWSVVLGLAEVCRLAGEQDEALAWLNRVPDSAVDQVAEARFRAAQLSMELGRARQTRELLHAALDHQPDLTSARRLLARVELTLTRWPAMREQIAQLDHWKEATATDVLLFCCAPGAAWKDEEHIEWLANCLENDPHDPVVRAALASHLIQWDRRAEARELLQTSNAAARSDETWRLDLGRAEDALASGKLADAASRLDALPTAADADARTWLARGRLWRQLQADHAAAVAFENASLLDPFDPEPAYALARLRNDAGQPEEASRLLERARLLQLLAQRYEDAMATDMPVASAVLEFARVLVQLDFRREAAICLRELATNERLAQSAEQLQERLQGDTTAGLTLPDRRALRPLPDLSAIRTVVEQLDVMRDSSSPAGHRFALEDVAQATGLDFSYFHGASGRKLLLETLGGGVAVVDFDNDRFPDLFFTQGCPMPPDPRQTQYTDRCFRNLGGRAWAEVTGPAGVAHPGYGQGCAVADFNNDGFEDLFVCNYGRNVLYRNNGDGTFSDVTDRCGITGDQWSTSAAFADFDADGDLDLYVVNYVDAPFASQQPCEHQGQYAPCRPMIYPAEQDAVWENAGDDNFIDRTETSGIRAPQGKGLGVVAADFNDDGRTDVFVGNDTTGNFLFENVSGAEATAAEAFRFREIGALSGVAYNDHGLPEACMGVACGDVDRDGRPDVFVTNFDDETNTLYQNLGGMQFADRTEQFGLADSSRRMLGWGTQFVDLDADGFLDLFVANGHLHDTAMTPQVFANARGERFREVTAEMGPYFEHKRLGRSVALLDWNGDLNLDLAVTDQVGQASLLQNNSTAGNRLALRLIGRKSNRNAVGARVTFEVDGVRQVRQVVGGGGYYAVNEPLVSIGLGKHERITGLAIRWPSGEIDAAGELTAGKISLCIEGQLPVRY